MTEERNRLLQVLRERSLKIGNFTLVSGKKSNYYFDSKFTTLHPEGGYLTALLILDEIRKRSIEAEAIGGLTLGADPIVSSVAALSFSLRERYQSISAFIVRKDVKEHGTKRAIEGYEADKGTRVIIIDDVCTTGGSTMKAVQAAEDAGFQVSAIICLVDREQGGAEALKDYPFYPLFTAKELLSSPQIQEELKRISDIG